MFRAFDSLQVDAQLLLFLEQLQETLLMFLQVNNGDLAITGEAKLNMPISCVNILTSCTLVVGYDFD